MGKVRLTADVRGESCLDEVDPSRIGELLRDNESLIWLDIQDLGPAELDLLRREFDFHELALEDVATPDEHERPRCDRYRDYYFLVLYAAEHNSDQYVPRELQMFWGQRYLITIHAGALPIVDRARARWLEHDQRGHHGIAYIAYALCDSLVNSYFPLQDWFGDRVDTAEEAVLTGVAGATTDLFHLRKDLLRTRRLLAPTSDVIDEVIRREQSRMPESLGPYVADMQAHLAHVLGELDGFRELLAAAQDVHAETMFTRLALVVQRLTAITVILMVPALVTGIYGMNVGGMFPSADSEYGFAVVVAVIVVMLVWGFIHSRLLGWI